ncbi:tryptophan synthase beta subunit-like PLP-dependent enzyme [Penicillium argentinense]|uniref:L-serine ammonia-lyase n=1 Tax=Penicillium argentinense TaxID=1131581 RepID=A0A9W9EP27_9EURO|nr:tryptophan synthase beta subunit-like PLP-dependent enzyme [Penicillium argentinense]KAJ5085357.1 tryptophan synthase beta subunit-like PLP-dependent enzyme [Penicillium argentinense]
MAPTPDIKKPWIETPIIESATLSKIAGCRIFLKLDLLQPSGSFKSRGVGNFIRASLEEQLTSNPTKRPHFYISSGGNAGLAAVHAALDLNCKCSVVVPHSTKPFMIGRLRQIGATEVIQHGASWFEADSYLREHFIENEGCEGNVYVPPFDHHLVWEGASSMVDEIACQMPAAEKEGEFPADAIVCSVGGGGLFNGIIQGLQRNLGDRPAKNVRVLAVETAGAHSLALSLQEGKLSSLDKITSQATSLGALRVARRAFENASAPPPGVEVQSVVGSDAEAARGIVRLADETRLQVELACGISVEVAVGKELRRVMPTLTPESRVVIVVCGGSNINAEMIAGYREQLEAGWE